MLIKQRYLTPEDASQQLNNTTVVLDGQPCHIILVRSWLYNIRCSVKDKDNTYHWADNLSIEDISRKDLQLEPIKLGYINNKNATAKYIQRTPIRKWKQGLYAGYIKIKEPIQTQQRLRNKTTVQGLMEDDGFLQMFYKTYPTFYRAYTQVNFFKQDSVAFHLHWAFRGEGNNNQIPRAIGQPLLPGERRITLEYKGDVVGECDESHIRIFDKFKYLTETFIEAMIHAS